ncbi:MAG: fibrobacter succinogenes major paralogous domain-containing protein [Rikenella sp.]|nr:fibrobacter succinogenes major paralogous domain-containing protein [Rikenella sp.]
MQRAGREAIRNPGSFYFSSAAYDYDWTQPRHDDLWRDGTKTLFDPCPSGWRVPRSGEADAITNPWSALTIDNATALWSSGEKKVLTAYSWTAPTVFGGTVRYITSFHRPVSAMTLSGEGSALLWSTTPAENGLAFRCSMSAHEIAPAQTAGRTNGLPVRCVRE